MSVDLQAFATKALEPLPGDNPCGTDAKYEPAYEEVTAQIVKLTSMSSAEDAIDFETIAENGTKLLMETTKDLNLAGFACYALLQTEGYAGLAAGLEVYAGIVDTFWNDCFPRLKRIKARVNAFEWLSDRLGDLVASKVPSGADAQYVAKAVGFVAVLADAAQTRFEEEKPSVGNLRSELAKRTASAPKPAAARAAGSPPATARAASAPATGTAAAPIEVKDGDASQIAASLRKLAAAMRKANPRDPVPYRIHRAIKWDGLTSAPPAQDGKTMLPGPAEQDAGSLSTMSAAGNHAGALTLAEDLFVSSAGTFWLDLQRHVHAALVSFGPEAKVAADAVTQATAALLARFPELADLQFAGGTPFADARTRSWLDEIARQSGSGKKVVQVLISPTALAAEKERSELALVKEKLAEGDLTAALAALQDAIDSETSPKLRFLRRLEAAGHCMDYGRAWWAKAILEDLQRDAKAFKFSQWEPELAREAQRTLVRAYSELAQAAGKDESVELSAKAETALDRLMAMDMRLAAAADPKAK